MANTGFKQAIIAYGIRKADGAPVDVNGELTSVSGRRQAIMLLVGRANPSPLLFEVAGYFNENGTITGNPTVEYDAEDCPIDYISATPLRIIFTPESLPQNITVISSTPWTLAGALPPFVSLDISAGGVGATRLVATRTDTLGQGYVTFTNTAGYSVQIYIMNVEDLNGWILETGFWDMSVFWKNNGLWNF